MTKSGNPSDTDRLRKLYEKGMPAARAATSNKMPTMIIINFSCSLILIYQSTFFETNKNNNIFSTLKTIQKFLFAPTAN